jgi:prepilin-type N-terminal cleavage/methylation domain-containing protein
MSATMRTPAATRARSGDERGFSLVEMLIAMAITAAIVGAAMAAMSDAMRATESAMQTTALNSSLRTAMDLIVRDLLQVGQGLPAGRVVFIPSGTGSTAIQLPGPPGTSETLSATHLPAVLPRPAAGPLLNGQPTDVITTLAVDSAFDLVDLTAFSPDGSSVTVALASPQTATRPNITDGGPDDIDPGDLIMLTKGSQSTLVQVTRVVNQVLYFDPGDSLNLNQAAGIDGTAADLRQSSPETAVGGILPTKASRIRMITYYVDTTTAPAHPRLVRRMNNGDPADFDNNLGTAVMFDVEQFRLTYDLADGAANPAGVDFDTADLDGSGSCSPDPCSANQIRKVNVVLSGRSRQPQRSTREFARNSLRTQVSLRSLAFVDRYR